MSKVKFFSAKKVLSAALALVMTASAMPMVFAAEDEAPLAPTEPLRQSDWTGDESGNFSAGEAATYGKGAGYWVSFLMTDQEFTFLQTKDDQKFEFKFWLNAGRNNDYNYGWVYNQDKYAQDLISPVGKDTVLTWESYIPNSDKTMFFPNGMLPALRNGLNIWQGGWDYAPITVQFTGNGANVYETALGLHYDGRENQTWGENPLYVEIPITVTVIDARQLVNWIDVAEKTLPNKDSYEEAGWEIFEMMYEAAKKALADPEITQESADTAAKNLQNAYNSLKELRPDIEALNNAIAAAQAKLAEAQESGYYIQSDVDALNAVIEEAKELAYYAESNTKEENLAMVDRLEAAVAALRFAPANYTTLENYIAEAKAIFDDKNLTDKYTQESLENLQDAYDNAKKVAAVSGELAKDYQATIDAAASTLRTAIDTLEAKTGVVTSAEIKLVGNDSANSFEGNVIYHKTPWYKTWTSQTVDLKVETNKDAQIASIEWVPANWSEDKPEAKIENYQGGKDDTVTIRPTFGIGPRSFWVKAIVMDIHGTTVETAPVKVRFINYDWQK